jgi:glycosyltransferase involved in cell wall biosynthesis
LALALRFNVDMSLSLIIPCLNEEESLPNTLTRAKRAFEKALENEELEIVVVDNASTDRSAEVAREHGARVLREEKRGYGAAILRGLKEAKGDYLVIGDADGTYDFEDALPLVEDLKAGAEFAIGNRLTGLAEPGAMPWLHQNLGTPVLTAILNSFYGGKIKDINCGLRAISRDALSKLKLRSPGMEFASEMVIHANKAQLKISERPIRYYRRAGGEAKLRTFRDGWRHLRFILLFAPFQLFVLPAFLGFLIGLFLNFSDRFGIQVLSSLVILSATQLLIFGVLAKAYLWTTDSFVVDRKFGVWVEKFRLEYGIIFSFALGILGLLFLSFWDLKNLIRGSTFLAAALQIFFSSFLLSILLFKKKNE